MSTKRNIWLYGVSVLCLAVTACVGPPLVITPTQLTAAIADTAYTQALASGADGSVAWSVASGALPTGLTLDQGSGVLAGTPTIPGTYTFTVVAVSAGLPQRTGQTTFSLTVIPKLTLDATLDPARVNIAYEDTPVIAGGVSPYSVTIEGLPGGLDYDRATGRIFGTPLNQYSGLALYVTVTDSGTPQQTILRRRTTLIVRPEGVYISTTALNAAAINQAYSFRIEALAGLQPYTWAIIAGTLPGSAGDANPFRLDQTTGTISGTAAATATTATFTVEVTDADTPASTDSRQFKLVVTPAILTETLPAATIGQAYQQALTGAGGKPSYTWTVSTGSPPAGLLLNPNTGVISGTPTAEATSQTFTARLTDSDTPAVIAEQELTINVGS